MPQRNAYPLDWPIEQPRTSHYSRKASAFREKSFAVTRDQLLDEIGRIDNVDRRSIVLTSNVPLRMDGLPYANTRKPDDPGVAVYFTRTIYSAKTGRWDPHYYAIACDCYRRIEENMRALIHTVSAMRTIQRHGSGRMLEQAMSGFAALPPGKSWREILGFGQGDRVTLDDAKTRYRQLVFDRHPDRGGSAQQMREIRDAMDEAERYFREAG